MHNLLISLFIILSAIGAPSFGNANDKPIAPEKNVVLIIESYHSEYPWDISYLKGINQQMGDQVIIDTFQMDTKRLEPKQFALRANLAWQAYKRIKPALVILGDDNALKYLGPKFSKTQTPVVYLGINTHPDAYGIFHASNITGVLERPLLKSNISLIKRLLPKKIKKIMILLDSGETSHVILKEFFSGKTQMIINDVNVKIFLVSKWSKWQQLVLKAKDNQFDAMIIGLYQTIFDHGHHVDSEQIIKWTSDHAVIPPFGFWDFAVGKHKTIGGIVLFGEVQGRFAAKLALRILNGESPADIEPIVAEQGRYYFSKYQFKKWKLYPNEAIVSRADFTE